MLDQYNQMGHIIMPCKMVNVTQAIFSFEYSKTNGRCCGTPMI